jgi:catechol 2,3-dioxygenase-like lactoylglutathione lyase family enzyme
MIKKIVFSTLSMECLDWSFKIFTMAEKMKAGILFIMAAVPVFVQAQQESSFEFNFNHVAISVIDVNRSADFYHNILDLKEITNRSEIPGIRWFNLREGQELHLISIVKEKVEVNKAVHLAVATPHFDSFVKKLEANKILFSDWPGKPNTVNIRADGIKQIFFQDPDGYWIEVNSEAEN